ncbi:MAG: SGNH/GDSL hydrolase family protein [Calditrichia bacterium]
MRKYLLIPQLLYILGAIFCIPFLPILILQGRYVKRTAPRLPEAPGKREGVLGEGENQLTLLALGESHVAGVGIHTQGQTFTGQIVKQLNAEYKRPICWKVLAASGYTVEKLDDAFSPQIQAEPLDLIIIGMGGNDTFKLNSPQKWVSDFRKLIANVRLRQSSCPILIANLPPVGEFPAFPRPLCWMLGGLVRLHAYAARAIPLSFENVYYMQKRIVLKDWYAYVDGLDSAEAFFSDRIHPSALTFQVWGKVVREFVREKRIWL